MYIIINRTMHPHAALHNVSSDFQMCFATHHPEDVLDFFTLPTNKTGFSKNPIGQACHADRWLEPRPTNRAGLYHQLSVVLVKSTGH